MSTLRQAIATAGLTEIEAMNCLTRGGKISDLCVTVDDVAVEDVPKAVRYIAEIKAQIEAEKQRKQQRRR